LEKRNLNTEVLIDMQPDLIVGFGLKQQQPSLIFYKSGLKVMFNGDWTNNPLGKAEWINGALYGLDSKANSVFSEIERIQRYFGFAKKGQTSSQRSCPRSMVRTTRTVGRLYF
jgi:hypothetical protein